MRTRKCRTTRTNKQTTTLKSIIMALDWPVFFLNISNESFCNGWLHLIYVDSKRISYSKWCIRETKEKEKKRIKQCRQWFLFSSFLYNNGIVKNTLIVARKNEGNNFRLFYGYRDCKKIPTAVKRKKKLQCIHSRMHFTVKRLTKYNFKIPLNMFVCVCACFFFKFRLRKSLSEKWQSFERTNIQKTTWKTLSFD